MCIRDSIGISELLAAELDQEQLLKLRQELSVEMLAEPEVSTLYAERMGALDVIKWCSRGYADVSGYVGGGRDPRLHFLVNARGIVDWEVAAKTQGRFFDQLDSALDIKPDHVRLQEVRKLNSQFDQQSVDLQDETLVRMIAGARSRGLAAGQITMELSLIHI